MQAWICETGDLVDCYPSTWEKSRSPWTKAVTPPPSPETAGFCFFPMSVIYFPLVRVEIIYSPSPIRGGLLAVWFIIPQREKKKKAKNGYHMGGWWAERWRERGWRIKKKITSSDDSAPFQPLFKRACSLPPPPPPLSCKLINTQAWLFDMCGYERVSQQTAKLLSPAGESAQNKGAREHRPHSKKKKRKRRKRDVPCVMVKQGGTAMAQKWFDSGYMEKIYEVGMITREVPRGKRGRGQSPVPLPNGRSSTCYPVSVSLSSLPPLRLIDPTIFQHILQAFPHHPTWRMQGEKISTPVLPLFLKMSLWWSFLGGGVS